MFYNIRLIMQVIITFNLLRNYINLHKFVSDNTKTIFLFAFNLEHNGFELSGRGILDLYLFFPLISYNFATNPRRIPVPLQRVVRWPKNGSLSFAVPFNRPSCLANRQINQLFTFV